MIVDIAVEWFARPPGGTAGRHHFHGMGSHYPVDEIDVMEMLLDDLVAANPDKGVPIAVLPFHIAPLGIARVRMKDRAAQVIRVERDNVADGAVVDLIDSFDIFAF